MIAPPPSEPRPRLAVCVTCKAGLDVDDTTARPGRRLYEALAGRCEDEDPPVDLLPVECLSLCEHGCSAAISAAGKWSYLLGGLEEAMADDLLTYARAYAVSKTGLVLPSKRPATLAAMVMGRMPPT
jgi:predicted metal-binding protein